MGVLDGKIAVVSGASRGIGKGCAQELGAAGATVYVTGRTVAEGATALPGSVGATAEDVNALGGKGIAVQCDLGNDAQVEALFDRVRDEQGRLDILVNSAFGNPGLGAGSHAFWETSLDWYDMLTGPGTRGAYVASTFAARIMVPQKSGLIVNVSALGAQYFYKHVAYGMGKAALDKLTKDAGRQLREHGVPVISIWPYFVKTEQLMVNVGKGHPIDLEGAESQRFVGKGVVALATDPDAMARTGKPYTSYELAVDYGYTDEDGQMPGASALPKHR